LAIWNPSILWTTRRMGKFHKQYCDFLWWIGKHQFCFVYHKIVLKTTSILTLDFISYHSPLIVCSKCICTWHSANNA
jgi:hypothetical protein